MTISKQRKFKILPEIFPIQLKKTTTKNKKKNKTETSSLWCGLLLVQQIKILCDCLIELSKEFYEPI